MSQSKSSTFKPFIRVTILSAILALLLIYLGINYHWGDYLKSAPKPSTVLPIPEQTKIIETTDSNDSVVDSYNPEIIDSKGNALLDSMNKEQITEHCTNLLRKEIKDQITLELATVNCVMSNYQETFQNTITSEDALNSKQKRELVLKRQCRQQLGQPNQYSQVHRELLIGICVSDQMNAAN